MSQPASGPFAFVTRSELQAAAAAGVLTPGAAMVVSDDDPPTLVVATSPSAYLQLETASAYQAPTARGFLSIAEENARSGYPEEEWQVSGAGDLGALGYASAMSVVAGTPIDFRVHSGGVPYTLEIVRLGWYGGAGARLVATLSNGGSTQPSGTLRSSGEGGVGSRDCAGWAVTDTWAVPADTTHGLHLAVIKRDGELEFAHIGPFVVRNGHADSAAILCKLSDMTWQAYNSYGTFADPTGGKSLYGQGGGVFSQGNRGWDVSYDRPLVVAEWVVETCYWNGERPVHVFLERNGYDVAYASMFDVDLDPAILLGRQVVMSCGHDEYWSQNVRDAWDAAVASGVHTVVLSGNTMLWRTRMTGRTMSCYKDSHSLDGVGVGTDPISWTGTWRDTRWPARRPECESIGTMFVANGIRADTILVPASFAHEPFWRATSVAALTSGAEPLKAGCLGFEWDSFEPDYASSMAYPPGLSFLSATAVDLSGNAADENGSTYSHTINPAAHRIVAFRVGTSVTVNVGTNQWGWGLSDLHARGSSGENTTMQQATVNLLADLGCPPATLQPGLVAASEELASWAWPTLTGLAVVPDQRTVGAGQSVRLHADATWSNGIVTNVTERATWTSTDVGVSTVTSGLVSGVSEGVATIAATFESASDTCAVTVSSVADSFDTFAPWDFDYAGSTFVDGPLTIGTRFRKSSSASIFVYGARFWRTTVQQSVAPVAFLGTVGGAVLASAPSAFGAGAPTTPGWETISFAEPVEVATLDDRVVWVWLPSGGYAALGGYFNVSGRLSQIGLFDSTGAAGAGKYRQPPSATPDDAEPTSSYNNNFYLVEPLVSGHVVAVDPGAVTGVTITPASAEVMVGDTIAIAALASWEHAAPTDVTDVAVWTSSDDTTATVVSGVVTGAGVGTATINATFDARSDSAVIGVVEFVPPLFDSYTPEPESYGGVTYSDGPLTLGTRFRRAGTGPRLVHGVRYWRSTVAQAAAPVAYYAPVGGGTATAMATSAFGAGAPVVAGWDTILFDTAIEIADGDHIVWVWLPSGGYAATAGFFAATVPSQRGLFDSTGSAAGRFTQPPAASPDTSEPVSLFGALYYWVDPLVTG